MRRRSAIEPVIGHIKGEHRMGRNYLAGQDGDAINTILVAAGYNLSLLIKWLRQLFVASSRRAQLQPEISHGLKTDYCSRSTGKGLES